MPVGHPIFWILVVAVVAPLLAEIPLGFKVPVVVLEVVLGIVIGPHVLKLVQFEGFVVIMFTAGMSMTLFMAGMELEFGEIKGRPLALAVGGWLVSALLGISVVGFLHVIPQVRAALMVTLALTSSGLRAVQLCSRVELCPHLLFKPLPYFAGSICRFRASSLSRISSSVRESVQP